LPKSRVKDVIKQGRYDVLETVATGEDKEGKKHELKLHHKWPVRVPRPIAQRYDPEIPLVTGQRVLDTFFPVAKGGTAAIPGPFGSGKCVTGDTPVLKSDGELVSIESLYEEHSRRNVVDSNGDEEFIRLESPVGLHSLKDERISRSNSKLLYKGKSDSIIEVRTRTGRKVRVTPIHKLFRVTETGEITETMAEDLRPGDFLASVRKIDFDNPDQPLDP